MDLNGSSQGAAFGQSFEIDGGTLSTLGGGSVQFNGTSSWVGGTLTGSGAGKFVVQSLMTVNGTNGTTKILGQNMDVNGGLEMSVSTQPAGNSATTD